MSINKSWYRLNVLLVILALVLPVTLMSGPAAQQTAQRQPRADIPRDVEDQYERSLDAAEILGELTRTPEGIPRDLLDRAYGIAVFPRVYKGAFIVGARRGKGILSVRQPTGWGTPTYVEITGGSFGLQIGGQATDLVLVFTNRRGVDSLLSSKLKLGADASVAAGPVGRTAEASTDLKLNAEIYAYSRAKGLFAGIALDGAVVDFDDSANRKVYGMKGRQVLARSLTSPVTTPFLAALRQYSPRATK